MCFMLNPKHPNIHWSICVFHLESMRDIQFIYHFWMFLLERRGTFIHLPGLSIDMHRGAHSVSVAGTLPKKQPARAESNLLVFAMRAATSATAPLGPSGNCQARLQDGQAMAQSPAPSAYHNQSHVPKRQLGEKSL